MFTYRFVKKAHLQNPFAYFIVLTKTSLIPFRNCPRSLVSFNRSTTLSTSPSSTFGLQYVTRYSLFSVSSSNHASLSHSLSSTQQNTNFNRSACPAPSIRIPKYVSQKSNSGPLNRDCASRSRACADCACWRWAICFSRILISERRLSR